MIIASVCAWRRRLAGLSAIACLALATASQAGAAELSAETLRAYDDYIGAIRQSFEERARTGRPLSDVSAADMSSILRDGRVLVRPGREDGIVGVPGGLIHHWRGVAFVPHATLQQAVSLSQDFAGYGHVYEPILEASVLDRDGDTFRVLMRLEKRSGFVSAVLDVWSTVQYRWKGGDRVYSSSDAERISEVKNAGKPDEEHLPENQGHGYLWRANTFSRFAKQDDGVLMELENVGLSRKFPPLLGWIIGPIARRLGKGSVEDSLREFRAAVMATRPQRSAVSSKTLSPMRLPVHPAGGAMTAAVVLIFVLVPGALLLAQRGFGGFGGFRERGALRAGPNTAYDGRFTFVRVRYETAPGGYWAGGRPSWIHGYPIAERNLMKIMNEVSYLGAHEEINTVALDDPELSRYPIAYLIEAGWWTLNDREAAALRAYLLKGGFLFIDDFKLPGWRGIPGAGWEPFADNMKRVLPDAEFLDMQPSDPVFHAFFEINDLNHFPQAYNSGPPIFKGIFEDNDRRKRLMAIVNYNTDVSQFWEWSGRGFRPFDQTNEAYKLGVNYLIYGLTH